MSEDPHYERAWRAAEQWPWLSSHAWDAMQPHKSDLIRWVAGAGGRAHHHRLFLHAICNRVRPLVCDMLNAGAQAGIQPYAEVEDKNDAVGSVFMPLCYAVSASHVAYDPLLVDLLLDAGADPFEFMQRGSTHRPLMASAIDTPLAIKDLLRRGYDPDMLLNMPDTQWAHENETALQYVCQGLFDKHTPRRHRRQSVQLLIEGGANLEQRQHMTGKTPLLLAVAFEPALIGKLVAGGADIEARGRDGDGVMETLDMVRSDLKNPKFDYYFNSMKSKFSKIQSTILHEATHKTGAFRGKPPRL
jgi:hypothetical protein